MNNNLNSYGYQEATKLYTWREETHDWRKYIEKHLDNHIENAKTTIVTRIDTAESSIGDIWGKIEKWPNTIN